MLCGWEGNRRSGVSLAMSHRHSGKRTYGLNGLGKGDEHSAYAPLENGIFNLENKCCAECIHNIHDKEIHKS